MVSRLANSRERRIAPRLLVEVMHLDAAEARRKAHQIREAQLRAGVVVPAGVRVLGGDAIGLDIDVLDLALVDLLVVHQAEQRLDGGLDVAAAGVRLDVAVGDAERRVGRQRNSARLVGAAERKGLHEAVARLDHVGRALHAELGEQRRLDAFARGVARVQALDVGAAVDEGEQAGGGARRDAERVGDLLRSKARAASRPRPPRRTARPRWSDGSRAGADRARRRARGRSRPRSRRPPPR